MSKHEEVVAKLREALIGVVEVGLTMLPKTEATIVDQLAERPYYEKRTPAQWLVDEFEEAVRGAQTDKFEL